MPDAIAGLASNPAARIQGSVDSAMSALGGMDSEGFLKLLVAQLQYQSPLDPQDPGDLMTQTATLAQLDATQQLLAVQQRGLGMQQAVAAAGMLGAEVTAHDRDGVVAGIVDAVRYTTAGPVLSIGGREVMLGDVRELRHTAGADARAVAEVVGPTDPGVAMFATAPGDPPGTVPIPDAHRTDRPA
jgi:flagellar basal-body rod modification protein FlgD